jgi:hypothetical protein
VEEKEAKLLQKEVMLRENEIGLRKRIQELASFVFLVQDSLCCVVSHRVPRTSYACILLLICNALWVEEVVWSRTGYHAPHMHVSSSSYAMLYGLRRLCGLAPSTTHPTILLLAKENLLLLEEEPPQPIEHCI